MANQQIDGLVQERRNSIADALELRLSCINQSRWSYLYDEDPCTWKDGLYIEAATARPNNICLYFYTQMPSIHKYSTEYTQL